MDEAMKMLMDAELEAEIMQMAKDATIACELAYPAISRVHDPNMFLSVIGCITDQWAADHDISAEKLRRMMKAFIKAQEQTHKAIGMPAKRRKGDRQNGKH